MDIYITQTDEQVAEALAALGRAITDIVKAPLARGPVIGYRVWFDLAVAEHHARRLRVPFPSVDKRKYGNPDVLDLYDYLSWDDTEHVVSRSMVNACRIYGVNVPEDDEDGADMPRLASEGRWDAIKHHNERDLQRTYGLAERCGVLPERFLIFDLETRPDERMADCLAEPKLGNVKDPAKVAAAYAEKRAAQMAKMAVDPWACLPTVIGIQTSEDFAAQVAESAFDAFLGMAVNDSLNAR